MKLLHIADLHFGKRVNGLSMLDEQRYVVEQLLRIADEEQVSGVLIAGDVFDRPNPSRDALEVCEQLFVGFNDRKIPVYAIPGNHDSAMQLSFCAGLLSSAGLHIAKPFKGTIETYVHTEGDERIRIHLLPFVRPADVRMALLEHDEELHSHDDAVRAALSVDEVTADMPNILVAHQFVTGSGVQPVTCESEVVSVGGTDNVDFTAFDAYDYVALGHLHGAQSVGRPTVRYSGSPLRYSLSEIDHEKSATILTIEDGDVSVSTRELDSIHGMREITASFKELEEGADKGDHLDYMHVTLKDKSLYDAMAKLRSIYPNILRLDWEHALLGQEVREQDLACTQSADPMSLFEGFFIEQTGSDLDPEEKDILKAAFEEASYEAPQT